MKTAKITHCQSIGRAPTYDLTMASETRNFVANGIVASNCAAHAFCYGLSAYQAQFLRHYHPQHFYCATFNTEKSNFDPQLYKRLAKQDNIEILPPDLTKSTALKHIPEGDNIRAGIHLIKGYSDKTPILKRKVKPNDFHDFFDNILDSGWGKGQVESAIFAGCLDTAFVNLKQLHEMYLEWNGKVRAKYKAMSDRTLANYQQDLKKWDPLHIKALEFVAQRIKRKVEAKSFLAKKLPNLSEELFEHFWKKHRTKFSKLGDKTKHREDIDKLVAKHSEVEDWTHEEKTRLKAEKLGYNDVDLKPYYPKIDEFFKRYENIVPYLAGSQSNFSKEEHKYFKENGLYFMGMVVSANIVKIGKEKKWDQLKIALASEEGVLECALTEWNEADNQIPTALAFMSVGDVVIVKVQINKLEFIDICPLKTRWGLANMTPLVANFNTDTINNPFSPPSLVK